MFKDYIAELKEKDFLEEIETKGKKTYSLNQKGFDFLQKYKVIIEFVEGFGL